MRFPDSFFAVTMLLAAPCLSFAPGCASVFDRKGEADRIVVRPPEDAPPMTPAEVGRRFRKVYATGLEFAKAGQYGLALGAFEEAVALRPACAEALFNLGACHEAFGDPLRAINIYRRVLELTPDDPDCYANLGTSFIKMYHRENSPTWRKMAREAWGYSLKLRPEQPDIQRYLARLESLD